MAGNLDLFPQRASHCGFITNGWIYIYGGQEESKTSESKIYGSWLRIHIEDLQWENYIDEGQFPSRHSSSCVYSEELKIALVYGGLIPQDIVDELLILNLENREFFVQRTTGNHPKVFMHTAVLHKRNMYVFGGIKDNGEPSAELFRLSLDSWEWQSLGKFMDEGAEMKTCGHCAGVWNDRMVVYGGFDGSSKMYNQFFVYSFEDNKWGRIHEKKTPRFCGNMIVKNNEEILLIGGYNLLTRQIPSHVDVVRMSEIGSFIEIFE